MLFNSYNFIFFFLPITLLGFYALGMRGRSEMAIGWLVCASLFFYGWWNPWYLGLIAGSIIFNYKIGVALGDATRRGRKILLAAGIGGNLLVLGYFKYANFFVDNINFVSGLTFSLEPIILPLALSFFTFQQVAYLVDSYRGEAREYNFLHFGLFVTFFPQLIAGPIVHHKEMLPQFEAPGIYRFKLDNLTIGITIFALGLFKKVVLADGLSAYATPVFQAAEAGTVLTVAEAWGGALAYTFQLYFDFSGYSDMAIGLARMFGIILPMNFLSPYKARNIIEFWRRWHITLSRFLRDYLYIPLGGNRRGTRRRYVNLMVTMLLGGLWHGASWTFVMWGGLHGVYLVVNHAWHAAQRYIGFSAGMSTPISRGLAGLTTFVSVVVSWVFFRATSFDGAWSIVSSMFGGDGLSLPSAFGEYWRAAGLNVSIVGIQFDGMFHNGLVNWSAGIQLIVVSGLIVFLAPNTQQFMSKFTPTYEYLTNRPQKTDGLEVYWTHTRAWAFTISCLFVYALSEMSGVSEFLYYDF